MSYPTGNLPFRYDAPMFHMAHWNENAPVFVPGIQTVPEISNLLPSIATAVANEVMKRANASPGRMFTFNQLANNNWNNQDFYAVVKFACDLLALNIRKSTLRYPEQGLMDAAATAVFMKTSLNLQEFPGLQTVSKPETVNAARQNVMALNNLNNEIAQMYQNHQVQHYPQAPHQQPQQGWGGQPNGWNQQPPPGYDPRYQQVPYGAPVYGAPPQPQPGMGMGMGMSYGGPSFGPPPVAPNFVTGNTTAGSRWASKNEHYSENAQRHFRRVEPTVDPEPTSRWRSGRKNYQPDQTEPVVEEEEVKAITAADWRPSNLQPYQTLTPSYGQKVFKIFNHGGKEIVVENITVEESEMDRSRHSINLLNNTYTLKEGPRSELLGEGVERLKAFTDLPVVDSIDDDETIPDISTVLHPTIFAKTSLENAIVEGRIYKLEHSEDEKEFVFRCFATVTNPSVLGFDFRDNLHHLMSMGTMVEVADMMSQFIVESVKNQTVLTPAARFIIKLNDILTKKVNDFIKEKLSLPTVSIDSFIEDIGDLRKYVEDKVGTPYAKAVDRFEKSIFPYIFTNIPVETEALMLEDICFNEQSVGKVTLFPESYSLTYVEMLDAELDIHLQQNQTMLIKEGLYPWLFKLAESLFETEMDDCINTHLLITADDRVYSLHRGLIGNDPTTFLISKADM